MEEKTFEIYLISIRSDSVIKIKFIHSKKAAKKNNKKNKKNKNKWIDKQANAEKVRNDAS